MKDNTKHNKFKNTTKTIKISKKNKFKKQRENKNTNEKHKNE